MDFKKISVLLVLSLAIVFWGCSQQQQQKAEAPKQERVTKNLVPAKAEIKSQSFLVELSNLRVDMTVDIASKEIVGTPSLKGQAKITNQSKDNMDIQVATLEYLDEAGKPIAFKSGEEIPKISVFVKLLKPGESNEGSFDAIIPGTAVNGNTLGKIEINLVYVPSPLKRETFTLAEEIK